MYDCMTLKISEVFTHTQDIQSIISVLPFGVIAEFSELHFCFLLFLFLFKRVHAEPFLAHLLVRQNRQNSCLCKSHFLRFINIFQKTKNIQTFIDVLTCISNKN